MRNTLVILKGLTAASIVASAALPSPPAAATFPGRDGRILFATSRDGNLEVYDIKRNGGSPQNLTVNAGIDTGPSISANGKGSHSSATATVMRTSTR
jgi:Tol biopolymer transport system component